MRLTPYLGRRRTRPRAIQLAIAKISRIDRLPYFPTHGAPRAASPLELRYKGYTSMAMSLALRHIFIRGIEKGQ